MVRSTVEKGDVVPSSVQSSGLVPSRVKRRGDVLAEVCRSFIQRQKNCVSSLCSRNLLIVLNILSGALNQGDWR